MLYHPPPAPQRCHRNPCSRTSSGSTSSRHPCSMNEHWRTCLHVWMGEMTNNIMVKTLLVMYACGNTCHYKYYTDPTIRCKLSYVLVFPPLKSRELTTITYQLLATIDIALWTTNHCTWTILLHKHILLLYHIWSSLPSGMDTGRSC